MLSTLYFRLKGFKIDGDIPADVKKFIVVAGPHTSNWDFFLGIGLRNIIKRDVKFVGKSQLFLPPIGWFFRLLGGYPVDRSKQNNFVDAISNIYKQKEVFAICISPEGSRSKATKLKSGFYHIARKANIPIVLFGLDFPNKRCVFAPPYFASDNKAEELQKVIAFFREMKGKHPANCI